MAAQKHDTSHRDFVRFGLRRLRSCKSTLRGCCSLLIVGVDCQLQRPPIRHCVKQSPPSGAHYVIAPKFDLGSPMVDPAISELEALERQLLGHASRHGPNAVKNSGNHGCHGAQSVTAVCHNSLSQQSAVCYSSPSQHSVTTVCYNGLLQQSVTIVCLLQ